VRNGHIKRITDQDIQSSVLEIMGTNVSTNYITCPANAKLTLGIKLPFLVMIIKNLKKYFTFEVQVLDDKNVRRRFRASNYQSTTRVKPFICTMPMRLDEGWNQIQFNLSDFTRRAYGTNYIETLRVQIHANCRIRRSDRRPWKKEKRLACVPTAGCLCGPAVSRRLLKASGRLCHRFRSRHLLLGPPLLRGRAPARVQALPAHPEGAGRDRRRAQGVEPSKARPGPARRLPTREDVRRARNGSADLGPRRRLLRAAHAPPSSHRIPADGPRKAPPRNSRFPLTLREPCHRKL
jgi:hypothetical protein